MKNSSNFKIAIVGLGYVGLPLAVEFGKKRQTIGFDINQTRIDELLNSFDRTLEIESNELLDAPYLSFTSDENDIEEANCYIVTVPTPIDIHNKPNLNPLFEASKTVGKFLRKGDIVIYESTVYPGATEEECVPLLEKYSGLKFNLDFYCGYSPERINPGDKTHKLKDIRKVVSGSTEEVARSVFDLYSEIISAGVYMAENIKVAEAAKIIENTQRDLNIALINELSIIFNKLGIDTESVLKAAATKWNFLQFWPGLVGGHCIGVDPYYLTYKAQSIGYKPEVILAGRRINDYMSTYVASTLIKKMIYEDIVIENSKVLVMGLTFKENCPDIRNTKVKNVIDEIIDYKASVDVYDPVADPKEVQDVFGIRLIENIKDLTYDAIIVAVAHDEFKKAGYEIVKKYAKEKSVIYDLKYVLDSKDKLIRL